jgi:hypothetical protein
VRNFQIAVPIDLNRGKNVKQIAGRLNWKQASIIMVLATIVSPYTTFLTGFSGHEFRISIAVYALL